MFINIKGGKKTPPNNTKLHDLWDFQPFESMLKDTADKCDF